MLRINGDHAFTLIASGEQEFMFNIELNGFTKLQLYLTGKVLKGVELFSIGPMELRGLGFMFNFRELINYAVSNQYRVFVLKEGTYFGNGTWRLVFTKNI